MANYRQRIYEQYASCFKDEDHAFDENAAREFARRYTHHLRGWFPDKPDARILDLACGSGRMLYLFKKLGFKNISGVDISPDQIQLAKQVTEDVTETDILEFLSGRRDEYDLITGIDIIEHLDKDQALLLLDGCLQALKPGGRLVLHAPNADTPWGFQIRYGDFTHEICFTSNALARLLTLCGFGEIEAREIRPELDSRYGLIRAFLWRCIRLGIKLWNFAEVGSPGSGVYTRFFLTTAIKPASSK